MPPWLIAHSAGLYSVCPQSKADTESTKLQNRKPIKQLCLLCLKLYGPLQPWFDKTRKPGDFELVE